MSMTWGVGDKNVNLVPAAVFILFSAGSEDCDVAQELGAEVDVILEIWGLCATSRFGFDFYVFPLHGYSG